MIHRTCLSIALFLLAAAAWCYRQSAVYLDLGLFLWGVQLTWIGGLVWLVGVAALHWRYELMASRRRSWTQAPRAQTLAILE